MIADNSSPRRDVRWLPLVYLVVLGVSWGAHFSFIKIAAESGLSYLGSAAVTTAGVAMLLLLIALLRRRMPKFSRSHLWFYFICSLLGYVAPLMLELHSAPHLPASVLTLVVSSSPFFTLAIAMAIRSDAVSMRRIVGIVVGTTSSLLILLPAALGVTDLPLFWLLVAFLVPLIYAADHNYIAIAWPANSDSYQLGLGEALLALAMLGPAYLWQGIGADLSIPFGSGHVAIAVMVAFALIEIFLYFEIVRIAGPVFVSQTNFVTVVSGVVWAMIIFGERPGRWLWLSALLLGVALYFVATQEGKARSTQTPR